MRHDSLHILHITPHLGGGVGRVLSQVAQYRAEHHPHIRTSLICLEAVEKRQFVHCMREADVEVCETPHMQEVAALLAAADIVQVEWWHHPLMAKWLYDAAHIEARWVFWSHTSGLHYPAFPAGLVPLPHAFMVTTAASLAIAEESIYVPSSGGFADVPEVARTAQVPLRYGYLGSLNAAKLHPDIMDYLHAVERDDFSVRFFGDADIATPLKADGYALLKGYTKQPIAVLAQLDVLVYLLNSQHYGTTENALLEAMAAGVVPIVLNNPVESTIVTHKETGLIVDSPAAFAEAVHWLEAHEEEYIRLSRAAASDVRARFSLEKTVEGLQCVYNSVLPMPKRCCDVRSVMGNTAFDWFTSGLGNYSYLFTETASREERRRIPFLYEQSKSSALHFQRYFTEDTQLNYWAGVLKADGLGTA